MRELAGDYGGLLVPGTVAAFRREGTGGFVLTLSATSQAPEYAIDPRFPLFQQALSSPKKSHLALAELFGVPDLIRTRPPTPDDFTEAVIRTVASNWAEFDGGYRATAGPEIRESRVGSDRRFDQTTPKRPPTSCPHTWSPRATMIPGGRYRIASTGRPLLRSITISDASELSLRAMSSR